MNYDDLLTNVKGHLRPSIELKLQSPRAKALCDFLGVREQFTPADREAVIAGKLRLLPNAVDRCITSIMAIGYNGGLDAAARDLYEMRSALGGSTQPETLALRSLKYELELSSIAFDTEIMLFARMHKLSQSGVPTETVLSQILDNPSA